MTNIFRVVIPTADGIQVAGEFPTLMNASLFQQVILTDRNLKCEVEWFRNGMWWTTRLPKRSKGWALVPSDSHSQSSTQLSF